MSVDLGGVEMPSLGMAEDAGTKVEECICVRVGYLDSVGGLALIIFYQALTNGDDILRANFPPVLQFFIVFNLFFISSTTK